LDPIKAYECLAIETPTVATPVAGFRIHADQLHVVDRKAFPDLVRRLLAGPPSRASARIVEGVSWRERAAAFEAVLRAASARGVSSRPAYP
jgi:hypothetical protein